VQLLVAGAGFTQDPTIAMWILISVRAGFEPATLGYEPDETGGFLPDIRMVDRWWTAPMNLTQWWTIGGQLLLKPHQHSICVTLQLRCL
tara:strand:+ start:1107 stop:1373 length:267 start_codon:yes stop_codon:yes gene_type:complete